MLKIRQGILAAVAAAVVQLPALAPAAEMPVSENLAINATQAFTWREGQTNVAEFSGPVKITLDTVSMSADSAVIWITPTGDPAAPLQEVEVALVGHASLQHGRARRSGDRLFVTASVRGSVRIEAQQRLTRNQSTDKTCQIASGMREESGLHVGPSEGRWRSPRPSPNVERPPRGPVSGVPTEAIKEQVTLRFGKSYSQRMPDGTLVAVIDGGIDVTIHRGTDTVTRLLADRGVVFTTIHQAQVTEGEQPDIASAVESVYIEGDVRILFTSETRPDARLDADQVLYEVGTDRAVLTNAVMHTTDPTGRVPIVMRARLMKQLSNENDQAEYRLQESALTTSSFATPTYAIAAEQTYVRQAGTEDGEGARTTFSSKNATVDVWGTPVLWFPYIGGTVTDRGLPLRSLDIGSSSRFGFFTRSTWGLFESTGRVPPRDVDLTYSLDYLADRGPAAGLDGEYRGQSVTGTTQQPESFDGMFRSYFILDHGFDDLGGDRADVHPPRDLRGRVRWEHQQFLPDDWQVQLRSAWISDPTFLEEYYPKEFDGIEPMNTAAYLKHQRDSEAITLLAEFQPNSFVTTQEFAQENLEIERLPELGYYRLGESMADDTLTLYSANTLSRLHFDRSDSTFAQLGYTPAIYHSEDAPFTPGLPAQGYTGVTSDYVNRGDFRQEIAYPITIDRFRVQPYVMGRYTGYDEAPGGGTTDRVFGGAGIRVTTAFWRTDDSVQSEFWDIHRMRHVIEPELHLFTSGMSAQRDEVFVFDQQVDAINDVSAAQVAVRQKWQTKRGGPQNWHSVDFLTWNSEVDLFANKPANNFYRFPYSRTSNTFQPDDPFTPPKAFHGLFFPSAPETSIPRNAFNNDESWRLSDSTMVLADQEYNLDDSRFATAAAGLAVRRGDRVSYYIGDRYIGPLDSNIASLVIDYELSTRYLLGMIQSYDFGQSEYVTSSFGVTRRFDRFAIAVRLTVNDNTGDTGVTFNLRPTFVQRSAETGEVQPFTAGR